MNRLNKIIEDCRVKPGKTLRLRDYDPAWAGNQKVPKKQRKELAERVLSNDVSELAKAQERLYASDSWSVLIILQAMDAAGKDGVVRHVMSGINPQGCQVFSFKQPSAEELDHNYLWRYAKSVPERGRIGIFNRSYYEEVLVVRVHPELIDKQRIPGVTAHKQLWKDRFEEINDFEKHLSRNGTRILKFFLNVSLEEQRERFLERLTNEDKHWKYSAADLKERALWPQYMKAYEDMLSHTSTAHAPWYIIPADHKWVTRALVAATINRAIRGLKLEYPTVTEAQRAEMEHALKLLRAEKI